MPDYTIDLAEAGPDGFLHITFDPGSEPGLVDLFISVEGSSEGQPSTFCLQNMAAADLVELELGVEDGRNILKASGISYSPPDESDGLVDGGPPVPVATGFDFTPLPGGNVLIEFFGDDGRTFNKQIVTPGVIRSMGLVSAMTDVALKKGPEVAKAVMGMLSDGKSAGHP